jgi:hypothetical protein
VASLLIGIAVEPFRRTVGLENVVIIYLLVVVLTAAMGGRTAGLWTAVAAALSYDFFLTTPYHQLIIDSAAQVITVADAPLDVDNLTRLDAEGHLLNGRFRPLNGSMVRWMRPHRGVVLQLVRRQRPVGTLIVIFRRGYWLSPVTRLALATSAYSLAITTGPAIIQDP